MLFNSLSFAIFLPIVFALYWFAAGKSLKLQNLLLLASSYFFYACWDYRFLFLLAFSTFLDYFTGLKMYEARNGTSRKFWFWLSIIISLGFLGVFKYYNFFAGSFAELMASFGLHISAPSVNVILPVGISFYTFHGVSYVIDIYRQKIKPERNFVDYAVFVSFFPLLVAGPIERATHLLPQVKKPRTFDYANAVSGLRQILWGLFKKVAVADQCSDYANTIFADYISYSGSTLVLGALFFAIQIYCDFSGYSDMALGIARLFGIELLRNFAYPYFSRDVAEFWRRWHISLSSWFRDYLYIPLGGSKGGNAMKIRNIFIIFLVSGFWHGANWTFIMWGLINAFFIMPSVIFNTNRTHLDTVAYGRSLPTLKEVLSMVFTFAVVTFAWIFFRSANVTEAFRYISRIFSAGLFQRPEIPFNTLAVVRVTMILLLFSVEWIGREHQYALEVFALKRSKVYRYAFYYFLAATILVLKENSQQFIYFQF